MNNKIGIGLCTYKRPEMLKQCLNSIYKMNLPEDAETVVLIADNDPAASAESTVEEFRKVTDFPVYYEMEKNRGIPFARNNIIKQGINLGITELAFIDDDEYAEENWLVNLWNYYKQSKADVVRGIVQTVYPKDTPEWVVKGSFYQRKIFSENEVMTSASTNNVLFNFKKICLEKKMLFDENFGMKGGSDTDFFRKIYNSGLSIKATNEAVVFEELGKERFKLFYLLKRKFRTRNLKSSYKNMTVEKWLKMLLSAIYDILRGLVFLPINCFIGKHKIISSLCNLTTGTAKLLGLFGIHFLWEEYKK